MVVSGTLTATGAGKNLAGNDVDVSIYGTFVGTVAVQRQVGDAWNTIESYTAPAEVVVENARSCAVRINCTAFTSGTISYTIQA